MLKALSDFFNSIGVHPVVGGFILGVGLCFLLYLLKRALGFEVVNPDSDQLARFKDPNAFASGAVTKAKVTMHVQGVDNALPDHISAQVMQALKEGSKIEAIKIFKDATGLGLKESKDIIEALQKKSGL